MRPLRTLFFTVLFAVLAQFALGQAQDGFSPERLDPVKLVKIFPNPATEVLSVKFETPVAKSVKLSLHNIIGNLLEVESEVVDEHEIRIRVKDLPTGVYFLALKEEGRPQTSLKFLKR